MPACDPTSFMCLGKQPRLFCRLRAALPIEVFPLLADIVVALHAVNSAAEVFLAYKSDGQRFTSTTQKPSRINLDDLPALIFGAGKYLTDDPHAWYDPKEQRWVLVLSTYAWGPIEQQPPLLVAVSQTSDPMGTWTVWALDAGISMGPGFGPSCGTAEREAFNPYWPQVRLSAVLHCVVAVAYVDPLPPPPDNHYLRMDTPKIRVSTISRCRGCTQHMPASGWLLQKQAITQCPPPL